MKTKKGPGQRNIRPFPITNIPTFFLLSQDPGRRVSLPPSLSPFLHSLKFLLPYLINAWRFMQPGLEGGTFGACEGGGRRRRRRRGQGEEKRWNLETGFQVQDPFQSVPWGVQLHDTHTHKHTYTQRFFIVVPLLPCFLGKLKPYIDLELQAFSFQKITASRSVRLLQYPNLFTKFNKVCNLIFCKLKKN